MDRVTLLDSTLPKAVEADAILRALRREKREAMAAEQALIDEVEACREIIIQVSVMSRVFIVVTCFRRAFYFGKGAWRKEYYNSPTSVGA